MNRFSQTTAELRDQEVWINFRAAPAEPEVNIPYDYVDEFHIVNKDGEMIEWELTEAEEDYILDKCYEEMERRAEPDDPYDPTDDPLSEERKLS